MATEASTRSDLHADLLYLVTGRGKGQMVEPLVHERAHLVQEVFGGLGLPIPGDITERQNVVITVLRRTARNSCLAAISRMSGPIEWKHVPECRIAAAAELLQMVGQGVLDRVVDQFDVDIAHLKSETTPRKLDKARAAIWVGMSTRWIAGKGREAELLAEFESALVKYIVEHRDELVEGVRRAYGIAPAVGDAPKLHPTECAAGVAVTPLMSQNFVGREEEMEWLGKVVGGSAPGIAVLRGAAGMGKSTLAKRFLNEIRSTGVPCWWIEAASKSDLTANLARAALELGSENAPQDELCRKALGWLAAKDEFGIILDNVEDVSDVEPVLARLKQTRLSRVLITTRLSVGWTMEGMEDRLVDILLPDDAIALLKLSAVREVDALWDGAAELVEELGYLPLAIEQVGAYMAQPLTETPHDFVKLLRSDAAKALNSKAYGSKEARTVARVWSVTFDRLSRNAPDALKLLGVLAWLSPDGIHVDIFKDTDAVDVAGSIPALAAWNLVSVDSSIIHVHRIVQAVARTPANTGWPSILQVDECRRCAEEILAGFVSRRKGFWPGTGLERNAEHSMEAYISHTTSDDDGIYTARILDHLAFGRLHQLRVSRYHGEILSPHEFDTPLAYQERAVAAVDAVVISLDASHKSDLDETTTGTMNCDSLVQSLVDDSKCSEALESRQNLARAYSLAGRHEKSFELFQSVIEGWSGSSLLMDDHHRLGARIELADAYYEAGDLARSVDFLGIVIAEFQEMFGPDALGSTRLGKKLYDRAWEVGRISDSLTVHQGVLSDLRRILGPRSYRALKCGLALAQRFRLAGQESEALALEEDRYFLNDAQLSSAREYFDGSDLLDDEWIVPVEFFGR